MGRPKKETVETDVPLQDNLENIVYDNLNKKFAKTYNQAAYFLTEDDPTEVKGWISTGSTPLDIMMSNQKIGGYPLGRVTEITGLESSGKSLLGAHALVSTQQIGGVAAFIDTEFTVDKTFMKSIGININKLIHAPLATIEDVFTAVEDIITTIRMSNKDKPVTILVDSVAAASTKDEMEQTFDKQGYATGKAILISTAMRKLTSLISKQNIALIFTNQLRMKMQAMAFSDPYCVDPYTTKIKIRYKIEK